MLAPRPTYVSARQRQTDIWAKYKGMSMIIHGKLPNNVVYLSVFWSQGANKLQISPCSLKSSFKLFNVWRLSLNDYKKTGAMGFRCIYNWGAVCVVGSGSLRSPQRRYVQ